MDKHKDKKERNKPRSESSSSSDDEWIEKIPEASRDQRDEWMSLPTSFTSSSHLQKRKQREVNKRLEREREKYNPSTNIRELNPYWKQGGDGLPAFKKPEEDTNTSYQSKRIGSSNWRKKVENTQPPPEVDQIDNSEDQQDQPLTDNELNALAAKLVKAEIIGDTILIQQLKDKLERGQKSRNQPQVVVLTQTNSKGYTKPLKRECGEYSGGKQSKRKYETHTDGQRMRYYPDDDKSLAQMFEEEKFTSNTNDDYEFMQMAGNLKKNDDLDDVFVDRVRRKEGEDKINKRNRDRAIEEHRNTKEAIDNCMQCLQSEKMLKHLMVSMGETVYLSLPAYEPLTPHHSLLIPTRHAPSSTHLDENEWEEILNFRRALTNMHESHDQSVIFFETAMLLHRHPHMIIHCIPVARADADLAPIYFKKAIDESETEWASNKKLVSLKGRDVRRAIPRGLPYFSVSFGMEEGFAHVIEDQRLFPPNFAQEIIGGILDLHHSRWRKPKTQSRNEQDLRIKDFTNLWANFDCTQ